MNSTRTCNLISRKLTKATGKQGLCGYVSSFRSISVATTQFQCNRPTKSSISSHNNNIKAQYRFVSGKSWAAERLKELGEDVEAGTNATAVEFNKDLLDKPPQHVAALGDQILELNVLEVNQLMRILQTRLKISDDDLSAMASSTGAAGDSADAAESAEPAKEKDAFDVKIGAVDAKAKIKIIKEVRAITGLGLKEAKELVENAPVVLKEGVSKEDAEKFKKALESAGAVVEIV